jgi:hypothetical protein
MIEILLLIFFLVGVLIISTGFFALLSMFMRWAKRQILP